MLKVYVGAIVGAAALAAVFLPPEQTGASIGSVLLIGALVALAEGCQLRYRHLSTTNAFNLLEGILAPMIFVGGGRTSLGICAAAIFVGDTIHRIKPLKIAFNVAQWTVAVAVAGVVFKSLRGTSPDSTRTLVALVVSLLVMSAVNQIALNVVLFLATGRPYGATGRRAVASALTGQAITIVITLVTGICLVAAYMWHPLTVLAGAVFVVGAYAAGRANASLHADHIRLEGMQRATHALATSIDANRGLPMFLAEARDGFEVGEVELVLFSAAATTTHSSTGSGVEDYRVEHGPHALAEALSDGLVEPVHLESTADGPAAALLHSEGHHRVLAAPLRAAGTTIGVLFLYDRNGMEGFERGELKVADALARELVGFLERVELLQAIDEERRKLADILGATSDGIFSLEADGTITSWNTGLVAITGYAEQEVVGTRHFGLLRPRDAAGRDVLVERWADLIETPGALPAELQIVTADGQTVWLSCSYSRIAAGEGRRDSLVVVARNITQARELERLKDDFVAVVSHELRTPLVPIKGWAQTLLNRGDRLNDDQRRTAVQSILAQAQKLESLVLNILEASRIEAGRNDAEGVADVAAVAARIVEDTLSSRPDRSVRLRPPSVPCNVRGSSVWVERAVSNLIANAIKYSPDDEPVDVAISTEGDDVVVAVTDRGPGIATDAQERIFERFERLEETRKQTGTGLGLYITRRLARAMGGDVTVSSMPGAGSTFLLRLPLAASVPQRFPEQRRVNPPADNVVQLR